MQICICKQISIYDYLWKLYQQTKVVKFWILVLTCFVIDSKETYSLTTLWNVERRRISSSNNFFSWKIKKKQEKLSLWYIECLMILLLPVHETSRYISFLFAESVSRYEWIGYFSEAAPSQVVLYCYLHCLYIILVQLMINENNLNTNNSQLKTVHLINVFSLILSVCNHNFFILLNNILISSL